MRTPKNDLNSGHQSTCPEQTLRKSISKLSLGPYPNQLYVLIGLESLVI